MKLFLNILLIYAILMAALGLAYDTANTLQYGAIDLRGRVVGARVFLDNKDPYFFKWQTETPDYYVDSRDIYADLPVSRLTVPPTVLLLHLPFAKINYKTQQIGWAILQWLLLLLSVLFFASSAQKLSKQKIIWIIGLLLIAASCYWRVHVEKGQIYILYVFLFALSYWLAVKKQKLLLSGIVLGINVALRPIFVLAFIPFILNKRWKIIAGGIGSIIGMLGFTFFFIPMKIWKSYLAALPYHESFHLLNFVPNIKVFPSNIVDGIKRFIYFSPDLAIEDSSLQDVIRIFFGIKIGSTFLQLALMSFIVLSVLILYKKVSKATNLTNIFLLGIAYVIVSEFFLPAARLSYSNVIWLPLFALVVLKLRKLTNLLNWKYLLLIVAILFYQLFKLTPKLLIISDYFILFFVIITLFSYHSNFRSSVK
ncbi:MAG: glycosyltransferase 87 family protein [Candidatus Cloacimonadota bacterium]|nr:glycosyltransferase 87 family protein [Candidatus Cloacimonadota bacterium]